MEHSITILQGDITRIHADAIVNAANRSLRGGSGVDGAIHRAAGRELLEECKLLHGCETGKAKVTKAYRLPAKIIIHTPGPVWRDGEQNEDALLASCYQSCLELAREHACKTIAFPSISTGAYGFPVERAAKIAMETIASFLYNTDQPLKVMLVCYDDYTKAVYEAAYKQCFDADIGA